MGAFPFPISFPLNPFTAPAWASPAPSCLGKGHISHTQPIPSSPSSYGFFSLHIKPSAPCFVNEETGPEGSGNLPVTYLLSDPGQMSELC